MSATNTPNRQRLDVEDDEARRERLGGLLASLANTSSPSSKSDSVPSFRPTPQPLPPSDALARVKAFLPLLQQSNAALLAAQKEDPAHGNVEDTQGDERVIQMDLGLGVYDVKGATEGVDGLGPVVDSVVPPEEDEDETESEEEDEDDSSSSESDESAEEDSEDSATPARIVATDTPSCELVLDDMRPALIRPIEPAKAGEQIWYGRTANPVGLHLAQPRLG